VHPQDSVLGTLADNLTGTGLTTTYSALIKKAFVAKFWNNTTQKITFDVNGIPGFSPGTPLNTDEYTQMEANFSLFFGLAIQLYESTLVANDSAFDRFMEGAGSQTLQENLGMKIFTGTGGCVACHAGAETTDVSVGFIQGADPITGVPQPLNKKPLNASEFMAFFTGTGLYDNGFHNIAVRPGGDTVPADPEYLAATEDIGHGADSPFNDPVSGVPFPLSFGRLGLWKADAPTTPAFPPWTATFYSPYVPPLPFGFRAADTAPYAGRVVDFGSFKTPALRNVELTGPYFHNGGAATLRQVVDFYTRGADFPATNVKAVDPAMLPIGFMIGSSTRKNELVAFLMTLTDQRVKNQTAPFDHPEIFVPIDGRAPVSPGSRAGLLANTKFRQIPAVGVGGLPAEGLLPIGTFLGLNPFNP
jgi:hypothetical protein